MTVRRSGSRERMIDGAVELLRERGTGGFTLDALLAHSGAPRGSVYHHFPGGRDEILLAAVRQASAHGAQLVETAAETGDVDQVLDRFARFWRRGLESSDYRDGCPVLAVAIDARADLPAAAVPVREMFDRWRSAFRDLFRRHGVPDGRAGRLATLAVAAAEGAIVLCQVDRSFDPLDEVLEEIRVMVREASSR